MGYESYLRKRRISVTSRRYKPTRKHRHSLGSSLSLSRLCSGRFYKVFIGISAFAQIFPRSQAMRESNTSAILFPTGSEFYHTVTLVLGYYF
jgi:hypothetical protein